VKMLSTGTAAGQGGCVDLGMTEGVGCVTIPGQGVDLGSNTGSAGQFIPDATTGPAYSTGGGFDGSPDVAFIQDDGQNDNISTTQYNGRVDYNITSKDSVAFSLFTVPLTKTFLPGGWVDGRQYNTFHTDGKNETAALLWTRTINPNSINEARVNV